MVKEQNMLDVFVILEGYCNLLIERLHLIEEDRFVISSIISFSFSFSFSVLLITLSYI